MEYYNDDYLMHYGVKGMKWGVRRFQNKDGSLTEEGAERYRDDVYLKKGTVVKRVSTTRDDPTYDNKKYVSINQEDHDAWDSYIGGAYLKRNMATWSQTYITTKDLKVMTSTKQGELYAKMMLDTKFKNRALADTKFANDKLRLESSNDHAENISRNIAMQTETGKAFIKEVLKENYGAIIDTHGTNVSRNPVIVLDPDSNLSKYAEPEYTKAVQVFLRNYYGRSA